LLQLLETQAYIWQDAEILVAKIFRPSLRSKYKRFHVGDHIRPTVNDRLSAFHEIRFFFCKES